MLHVEYVLSDKPGTPNKADCWHGNGECGGRHPGSSWQRHNMAFPLRTVSHIRRPFGLRHDVNNKAVVDPADVVDVGTVTLQIILDPGCFQFIIHYH